MRFPYPGRLVAFGALTATLVLAIPAAAQAAPPGPGAATSTGASASTVSTVSASGSTRAQHAVTPATVLVCVLAIHYPHNSGHAPENINVTADYTCPVTMPSLSISVTLWKIVCTPQCHDVQYGPTGTATVQNKTKVSGQSAALCSPGDYFGVATGVGTSPPGVTPPTTSTGGSGNTVPITC